MPNTPLTYPVLSDPNWGQGNRFERDGGIPTYSLISRTMELLVVDGSVTGSTIQSALDDPVPDVEWDMPPDLDDPDGTAAPADDAVDGEGVETEAAAGGPFGGGDATQDANGGFSPPYGGSACSAVGSGSASPWSLLGLLGFLGLARRRR